MHLYSPSRVRIACSFAGTIWGETVTILFNSHLAFLTFGAWNAIGTARFFPQEFENMAEVIQNTQQEFWRPPSHPIEDASVQSSASSMAVACLRCGTEFLLGSHFCHACGGRRPEALTADARADAAAIANLWEQGVHRVREVVSGFSWNKIKFPGWMHYLHFHEIKSRAGLSTGSLIAFVIGLACVAGALLVGLLTAKTLVDWQAIQFYRAEWLLAATAAFVAGILLKKPSHDDQD
jgi:hypothetical protein